MYRLQICISRLFIDGVGAKINGENATKKWEDFLNNY